MKPRNVTDHRLKTGLPPLQVHLWHTTGQTVIKQGLLSRHPQREGAKS